MSKNNSSKPTRCDKQPIPPMSTNRERKSKNGLCVMKITVRRQTAYHLNGMAKMDKQRNVGRVVDKLVREHQLGLRATGGEDYRCEE